MMSKMNPRLLRRLFRLSLSGLVLWTGIVPAEAQTVSFNFSGSAISVPGWTNVVGDPSVAVITATAAGITVNSVATVNWSSYEGVAAQNGNGSYPGSYFPSQVMSNNWFQYNGSARTLAEYNVLTPQLQLSGLNPDSSYILRMSGSDGLGFVSSPTIYTVAGATVYSSQSLNVHDNLTQGVTFFGIYPNASGVISIYVNTTSSTDIASICGLQVFPGNAPVGTPAVAIVSPINGTVISEGANLVIKATAIEAGATITKVEFFADTAKIGEVDTVPYTFTWVDPDPGSYTITARATDNTGTINTAVTYIGIKSLNYYWSTTGNVGNNADSTFIGNVDSVRLDFRTKDIQRMSIMATGNIGIGTIAPSAQLHTTGSVRLAGLKLDSAGVDPRIIVSDSNGNLAYRNSGGGGGGSLTIGPGLGQTASGAVALGDTISGSGPHNFTASRYEYLNGYQYSIGGTVNDPVNMPNFRLYDNGDLTAGTTMNRSVNTLGQTGMRYYAKLGMLQLGASDWLDTTQSKIVYGIWPGSGLLINSDTANTIKGKLMNTVFVGDNNVMDSLSYVENCIIAAGGSHFAPGPGNMDKVIVVGYGNSITAPVNTSIISGVGNSIAHPLSVDVVTGLNNVAAAAANGVFVSGVGNQYGAVGQFIAGQNLINRVTSAATLGNANVDFPTISYNALAGTVAPGDPLFTIGNSSSANASIRSNALTILYNGRTQINTTGYSNALAQTDVTPKAALEVVSTNTGVLLPKLTTAQRNAIVSADLQNGLLLYNTDSSAFQYYNGSSWNSVGSNIGNGGWGSSGNAGTNPATNFIGTTDTERLVFRTNDTARMTILANGSVGIGTAVLPASDAKLAVDGTVYTTKVRVTQIGWPDYVFDKGYSLPGLASVERYIRQYGHLPGMVSASEVKDRRVDLGDNQAALLKKIEELTLYLLEEHKKAGDQQREIERLKAQNKMLDEQQKEIDMLKEMVKKLTAKTN
jgi:Bacterial Ig domain